MTDPEKEKLDLLLERNASQQLAKVDWQALSASISSHIRTARQPAASKWPGLLRIAAAIAATAVLLLGGRLLMNRQMTTTASVEFTHSRTKTVVQILDTPSLSEVTLSPAAADISVSRCKVEIVEPAVKSNQSFGEPTWIIICKRESSAKNGTSDETASMLCLF